MVIAAAAAQREAQPRRICLKHHARIIAEIPDNAQIKGNILRYPVCLQQLINLGEIVQGTAGLLIHGHVVRLFQHILVTMQQRQLLHHILCRLGQLSSIHNLPQCHQVTALYSILDLLLLLRENAALLHQPIDELNLSQANLEILQPCFLHDGNSQRNHLRIGSCLGAANQLHPCLMELALTAGLGFLIAENAADIGQLVRQPFLTQAACHHPGNRRGHLVAQCHGAVLLVKKLEHLGLQIAAVAHGEGIQKLNGRRYHLIIAPQLELPGNPGLNRPFLSCLLRQKITGSVWNFQN